MKEKLTNDLKHAVVNVKFRKKDGSLREMRCTLQPEVLKPFIEEMEQKKAAAVAAGKTIRERAENPNQISVIDVDKNEWRSFTLDSIIETEKE